ncbi:MAG: tetratricopeptide repeat protein [Anaerolineales bacterium]|nr:tetratricopeptide repeat protein [Anaerolineales bacterium]
MPSATVAGPESFQRFGALLKHLRLRAGLTQRELALAVGYHYAHLSRLEHDQRLPDTATLLALFVPALGLESEPEWALRLVTLAAAGRGEALPAALAHIQIQTSAAEVLPLETAEPAPGPVASRVPVPLTPLLGRDTEQHALRLILLRPEVRLLTIMGPPGIGKTRLGLQAAADLAGRYKHGALFIDLSLAHTPEEVAAATAQALDLPETPGQPPADAVGAALRERHQLLLFDNFEQARAAAPLLAGWLRAAPRLKALVTSREHLRLAGEHEFTVPSLDPAAAAELFQQRAQAVQPDFVLTAANAPVVAEICARLDGLPLAIELAAARVRLLPPAALRPRLDQRLAVLTQGAQDGPAGRQTLRGAIDWSYDLLLPAEQRVFAALAVFAGPFGALAAEVVTGAGLEALEALTGKSLVQVLADPAGGAPRLRLLETLREYALERLRADPPAQAAALSAHGHYYAALAERCAADLHGAGQATALATLDAESDNLRAALAWAEAADPALGLRLGVSLFRMWQWRGRPREGQQWLQRILAAAPERPELADLRARTLRAAGALATSVGDFAAARGLHQQALTLAQTLGDRELIGAVLNSLAVVEHSAGDLDAAAERYAVVLAERRAHGRPGEIAQSLNNIGVVLVQQDRCAEAEPYLRESLTLRQTLGDPLDLSQSQLNLAHALAWRQPAEALPLAAACLETHRALNVEPAVVDSLLCLAEVHLALGEWAPAAAHLRESLTLSANLEDGPDVLRALERLAWLAAAQGDHARAVWFAAAADHRRAAETAPLEPVEAARRTALLATARTVLTPEAYALAALTGAAAAWPALLAAAAWPALLAAAAQAG